MLGSRVFVADGSDIVFCLDLHTGKQLWRTVSPVSVSAGSADELVQPMVVSDSMLAVPVMGPTGVLVLRPADGSVRWSSTTPSAGSTDWLLALDGRTLYAASSTTLSACRSQS